MSDTNNQPDKAFMAEYKKPRAELKDAIMKKVLTNDQQKKAWKRREKAMLFIYIGAILFVFITFFFLSSPQPGDFSKQVYAVCIKQPQWPYLSDFAITVIVTLLFSLISFGIYFVKSRRSNNA